MTVSLKKLNEMVGKDVLIVQIDGKAFKGRLSEIDAQAIHITNALEFNPGEKKWKIPVVMVPPDNAIDGDIVRHDKMETIHLRDIVLAFSGIMRIYPLSMKPSIAERPPIIQTPILKTPAPPVHEPSKGDSKVYVIKTGSDRK